jgi:hypothetical protein
MGAILVAAVSAASRPPAAPPSRAAGHEAAEVRLPPGSRAGEIVSYGHIAALTRKGRRFEMRFDPAWWLGGATAARAAAEDGAIRPGEPVPNDYYIVEEGHRLLTYVVPATARVTILTGGIAATPIAVSELAQIVRGGNPRHRRLLEPRAGFWIRVGDRYPNPVLALDQQYQP